MLLTSNAPGCTLAEPSMAVLERTASASTGTSSAVEEDEDAESVVSPVGVSMSARLRNVGSPSTERRISMSLE